MTAEIPHIPSYLEAFTRGLSDRDKIRLFLTTDIFDMIPPQIETGFLGFTVSRVTVLEKLLAYINGASDELVAEVVKRGKKRFG